jgi:hypothetical protein
MNLRGTILAKGAMPAGDAKATDGSTPLAGPSPLALESAPQRRAADLRRPLHDHEAGALEVPHNLSHDLVDVMDALAATVAT